MLEFDTSDCEKGSKVAWIFFELLNYLLLVLGTVVLIAGIYMSALTTIFSSADFFIIATGVFVIGLGLSSFYVKDSAAGLFIYTLCVALLFVFLLAMCVLCISGFKKSIELVSENLPEEVKQRVKEQAKLHRTTIFYALVAATLATVSVGFEQKKIGCGFCGGLLVPK